MRNAALSLVKAIAHKQPENSQRSPDEAKRNSGNLGNPKAPPREGLFFYRTGGRSLSSAALHPGDDLPNANRLRPTREKTPAGDPTGD